MLSVPDVRDIDMFFEHNNKLWYRIKKMIIKTVVMLNTVDHIYSANPTVIQIRKSRNPRHFSFNDKLCGVM